MININYVNENGDHVMTVNSTKDNDWDAHLEGQALLDDGIVNAADFDVSVNAVDDKLPIP